MKIAERVLKFRDANGEAEIPVVISLPEQESDGAWFCQCEIGWPEGKWSTRAGGVDSIQAIQMAMQLIGTRLYVSEYHEAGKLYFEKPGNGYGFPVPISLRDLLIGDDAKYL